MGRRFTPRSLLIRTALALAAGMAFTVSPKAAAGTDNPNRSLFAAIGLGGGFDLAKEDRHTPDIEDGEAYSIGAFIISVGLGYRFNENWGLEARWNDAQHRAPDEWGRVARYTMGQLSFRAALPLETRQTPVLRAGVALGRFAYGSATPGELEENDALVVGPALGLVIEHELILGLVATLAVDYLPMFRKGMDGVLVLDQITYHDDGTREVARIGTRDFTNDTFVHLLWIKLGVNFEWTFR